MQLEWAATKVGEGRGSGGRGVWVGSIGAPWVPVEAGASAWGGSAGVQCCNGGPRALHITQQWYLSSAVAWASPRVFLVAELCVAIPSDCFLTANSSLLPRPAPHCALAHTGGHPSQAGVRRAVAWAIYVGFPLSCLPVTGCFSLHRAPKLSFSPSWWPCWWGASPDAGPSSNFHSPPGMQPHSASSLLPFPFFFLSSYLITQESVLPLPYLRSSARIQQVLWEHFSVCRCIFDALKGETSSMSSYSSAILLGSQDSWEVGQCGVHLYIFISVRWVSNVPTFISDFSNLNL